MCISVHPGKGLLWFGKYQLPSTPAAAQLETSNVHPIATFGDFGKSLKYNY